MRDEPLKFGINAKNYSGDYKYTIEGLDLIEPFGWIECGEHKLYTTESLAEKSRASGALNFQVMRSAYIYADGANRILRVYDGAKSRFICFGKFVEECSEEEQAQIRKNLPEIMALLSIEE